jgi:hypothetical protein
VQAANRKYSSEQATEAFREVLPPEVVTQLSSRSVTRLGMLLICLEAFLDQVVDTQGWHPPKREALAMLALMKSVAAFGYVAAVDLYEQERV